ncbi:MAG: DUF2075 domain-containing protein [Desulfobacteraceae bacterium]|nr:MAG: DUF2075 domain-containing protein [Desulfobacteraceae bacterium]
MYTDYWGLKEPPFENVPSDRLFRSPQHEEALMRLIYAVDHRKAVAMLTGDVGTGKTTVAKAFMKQLSEKKYDARILSNPALGPVDLIKAILLQFGEKTESNSKTDLLNLLSQRLYRNSERNLNSVLMVDEAHVINDQSTLDELRMMLNLHANGKFLITLVLLGQPPLLRKISSLQPLKERIGVKYHLEPLDLQNTIRYIMFRLKAAGAVRGCYTKEAVSVLHGYTEGLPLRINNICDRCLLIGFMRKAHLIDAKIVNEAIEDTR